MSETKRCSKLNRGLRGKYKTFGQIEHQATIPFGDALQLHRYTLSNGMNIIAMPDSSAPVVSYQSWFRVGSRDERPGKTGLAHFLEHLMFKETKNTGPGEFDRLLEQAGGETNAATWVDWTYYYENIPRSELELAVRLEADRLQNLVLRDEEVVAEREVVKNEREFRVEDDAEGIAEERLYATAFREHPYHWPTIGWMKDIESYTTDDCMAFYQRYYAPNNCTLIVAGDLDLDHTLSLVQEYYGAQAPSKLPRQRRVIEPAQSRARRQTVRFPCSSDKLLIGFSAPWFGSDDWVILNVLCEVLFSGRSSRVNRRLVHELELASTCRASIAPFRDPGLFDIWISMREGKDHARALAVLEQELQRIRTDLVTEKELERAKNRIELAFLHGMETVNGKAEQIGFFELVTGSPEALFHRLERSRRVTAEEIQRVASEVFLKRNQTLVTVRADERADKLGDAT